MTQTELWQFILLLVLIFISRILDQTIGTMRLIFLSKGHKYIVPVLGFFEVLIWALAIGQIMKHLDNIWSYLSYAGGFAAGNYIGMLIEEKLSIGTVLIRIIPKANTDELIDHLRHQGYRVTTAQVEGRSGPSKMLFTIVKRRKAGKVLEAVNNYNPSAFYAIEEVRSVKNESDHLPAPRRIWRVNSFFRKGK